MTSRQSFSLIRRLSTLSTQVARNERLAVLIVIGLGVTLWLASWLPDLAQLLTAPPAPPADSDASWQKQLADNWPTAARDLAKGLLSGSALVAIVINYLRQSGATLDKFQVAWLVRRHTIICGITPESRLLAESLIKAGGDVVVVGPIEPFDEIAELRAQGIFVIHGDPASRPVQKQAGLLKAAAVVCMNRSDELNIASAETIRQLSRSEDGDGQWATCFCQIMDGALRNQLEQLDIVNAGTEGVRIRLFNIDDLAAAHLLERYPPERKLPRAQQATDTHVALIGGGSFALAMIVQMAQRCHYWRDQPARSLPRTRLTLIDPQVTQLLATLRERIPAIDSLLDLQGLAINPGQPDIFSPLQASSAIPVCQYFVALDDEIASLAAASRLDRELTRRGCNRADLVVAVLHAQRHSFAPRDWSRQGQFGIFESHDSCTGEVIIGGKRDALAAAAHAHYLANMVSQGHRLGARPNLVPWEQLGEFFRSSNRQQVAHLQIKRRALAGLTADNGLDPATVEGLADMEHRRWMAFYLVHGWVAAARRNDAQQEHDCLIPYVDLPESVKQYSRDAVRTITPLDDSAGEQP